MISEIIEKWIKGILIDGITGNLSGPVSYTHLDVYKRQGVGHSGAVGIKKVLLGFPVGIAGVAGVVDVGQLGGGGVVRKGAALSCGLPHDPHHAGKALPQPGLGRVADGFPAQMDGRCV